MLLDRRTFLGGCAASLAGAASSGHRIDVHHHLFPATYSAAVVKLGQPKLPEWSPARSIEEMDKSGIAVAVLSLASPLAGFPDASLAFRLAREVNEYGARAERENRGRFGLFAAVPFPGIDGSLREIEYALDSLKADGICLMTSYGDKWLGDGAFAPVWEELNRRKTVVYTHPRSPDCCGALNVGVSPLDIEWATDTTRTMASLLFSGTAARYPGIRWIFSHGGGTTPYLLSRFTYEEKTMKEREKRLPNGVLHELRKFYYDVAQANHPGALAALLKLVAPSQILYGTDYPFRTGAEVSAGLSVQGFAPGDLRAIERDNALGLLPKLPV